MPSPPENLPHATEPPLSAERCLADFQAELSAGRQPSLEHHLYRTPPEEHGRVFEQLLSAELRFRQNRREPLSAEQYSRRFPQFGAVIPSLVARALEQAGRDSWEEPGPNDTTRVFVPAQSPVHSPVVAPSPTPAGGLENFPRGPSVPQPLLGAVSPALDQRAPTPAARSASEPLPPRVGKYEVRRLLGKGGFGRVYLCYDPDLDDEVAVKVLLTERDPRDLLQTLRDEGRKNRQLHNKGAQVVPVLETGTDQFGSPFMVMKYLSGGTLKDQLVKRGAHPWREAVQLVGDLAKTLKILHADDIYHRDIKPLNILLDDAGRPHLADFGLAARIELLDTEGSGHSPGYASPEQILYGPSRIDGRSDLYSLGVVFYELLTGKLPIEYQRRLKGDYERRVSDPGVVIPPVRQRNPQVPEAVAALCERCLRWDRNERPQTAADLVEALGRFSDTSTELPSQPSRASHRLAYKAVGGALAVIAVMLFITTLNRAQPSREHLPQASLPESPSRTVSTKLTTPFDIASLDRAAWSASWKPFGLGTRGEMLAEDALDLAVRDLRL
ncbi:MAG: serine/threonine-protein kinase [Planctomycetaceae bacterium]